MSLLRTVMNQMDCDAKEAEQYIEEMKERVLNGENPETVLEDYGAEPDYFFDILPY